MSQFSAEEGELTRHPFRGIIDQTALKERKA